MRTRFLHVLAPLALLLTAACGIVSDSATFQPNSDWARASIDVYDRVLWWMGGIFVVVEGLLVYALIRYRRRPGDSRVPEQVHGHTMIEVAWTLVPAVVLFFIAIPTAQAIFKTQAPAPADALEVTVVGHQWWWEFEYPELGIRTANELHVPSGRTTSLTLTSADVIHSFWVPELGGKRDLNPGGENVLWFTPDVPGEYSGQCAEFCGSSHANMRLRVFVDEPDAFAAWVDRHRDPAPVEAAGVQTFLSSGCMACHTISGTPAAGRAGPDLTGFGARSTLASGILPNTAENLAGWLRSPDSVKPGALMPDLNLSEERIDSLVAFLRSLE